MNTMYLLLRDAKLLLRDITYKLYINTMYLLLRVAKLHSQVIHKYSVPPSERCQTPFEGFHLRVIHKGS